MFYQRLLTLFGVLSTCVIFTVTSAGAAPYAAMVMDARSGEVIHANNADSRLHPASLTKMMTLYVVFEAIQRGEITLDTPVSISSHAASEPPSKLGLRAGQTIALRYLIRAAAVKSANDAATALGEAISGSEAAFAERMNRTAQAVGMTRSTFRNAHGLTQEGHLSTARDMTIMGRRLFYDFPQYYNIFSRQSTDAGVAVVNNTNRRFLSDYRGADGIKTGFTNAAGFNLVASAERDGKRIIATVFGGQSTPARNAKVAELLDLGFSSAPAMVAVNQPAAPNYAAVTASGPVAVARSLRPTLRPAWGNATADLIAEAVAQSVDVADMSLQAQTRPPEGEIVTRMSSSGGRHYGINIGRYGTRYQAEQELLKTALAEISTLEDALRKVVQSPQGWEANFVGMTQDRAAIACQRLVARDFRCNTLGPG